MRIMFSDNLDRRIPRNQLVLMTLLFFNGDGGDEDDDGFTWTGRHIFLT